MKTKLLKKVRKRYTITHMPNGFVSMGRHYEYNLYKLTDSHSEYYYDIVQCGRIEGKKPYCKEVFETEQECIAHLKDIIIYRLKKEGHLNRKMRIAENTHEKKYYINKK